MQRARGGHAPLPSPPQQPPAQAVDGDGLHDDASEGSCSLSFAAVGGSLGGTPSALRTPSAARPMALCGASPHHQSPTTSISLAPRPALYQPCDDPPSPMSSPTLAPPPQQQQHLQEGGGDSWSPSLSSPTFAAFNTQPHACNDTAGSNSTPNSSRPGRPQRPTSPVASISFGHPGREQWLCSGEVDEHAEHTSPGPAGSISRGQHCSPQPSAAAGEGCTSPAASISLGEHLRQNQHQQPEPGRQAEPIPGPAASAPSSTSFNFASAPRLPPHHAVAQTPAIGRAAAAVRSSSGGSHGLTPRAALGASGHGGCAPAHDEALSQPSPAVTPASGPSGTLCGAPPGVPCTDAAGRPGLQGGMVVLASPVLPKRTGRGAPASDDCSGPTSAFPKMTPLPTPSSSSSSSSSSSLSAAPVPRYAASPPCPTTKDHSQTRPQPPAPINPQEQHQQQYQHQHHHHQQQHQQQQYQRQLMQQHHDAVSVMTSISAAAAPAALAGSLPETQSGLLDLVPAPSSADVGVKDAFAKLRLQVCLLSTGVLHFAPKHASARTHTHTHTHARTHMCVHARRHACGPTQEPTSPLILVFCLCWCCCGAKGPWVEVILGFGRRGGTSVRHAQREGWAHGGTCLGLCLPKMPQHAFACLLSE